jgi:hypothetical protein
MNNADSTTRERKEQQQPMSAKTQTFVNHSSAWMGKPQSLLVLVHHWRGPAVVGREHTGARREDVSPCSPHGGVGGGKECAGQDVWSTAWGIRT